MEALTPLLTLPATTTTTTLIPLTLLILLLTLFIIPTIIQYNRLSHIPGPRLNALTSLVYARRTLLPGSAQYVYDLCKEYGPLVRVTPNIVVFSDPETFRYVCSHKANYTKGLWFEFSRWDLKRWSCIAMRDNESRRDRKRRLIPAVSSPPWSGAGLAAMEKRIDEQVKAFVDLVERKYISTSEGTRPMEFAHRAQFFTLDVATGVTFGRPFGFLERDGDVNRYLEITEVMLPLFGVLGALPQLVYAMHAWPLRKMMPGAGDKVGFGVLMKFAEDEVKKRLEAGGEEKEEQDLIKSYLDNGIEPEDVVQECITLVVAGSETTSVVLRMALLALLTTPEAYRKLQAEIDAFFKEHNSEEVISYTEAKGLKYLWAVIHETMRVWPNGAGLSFSKQVPDTGDTIHGYYLPKGTEIAQCMLGITRDKALFGPDVDIWRPERWLEASPEHHEEMWAAVELGFSTGKYICLGKQVALMELGKWFSEIFRRYEIAPVNKTSPLKLVDGVTWLSSDFSIRFAHRERE
ncbi:cytochrome P450, partial [Cercophora samala]